MFLQIFYNNVTTTTVSEVRRFGYTMYCHICSAVDPSGIVCRRLSDEMGTVDDANKDSERQFGEKETTEETKFHLTS